MLADQCSRIPSAGDYAYPRAVAVLYRNRVRGPGRSLRNRTGDSARCASGQASHPSRNRAVEGRRWRTANRSDRSGTPAAERETASDGRARRARLPREPAGSSRRPRRSWLRWNRRPLTQPGPPQSHLELVGDRGVRRGRRGGAGDDHDVPTHWEARQDRTQGLANPSLRSVADYGVADALAGRDADPDRRRLAPRGLDDEKGLRE